MKNWETFTRTTGIYRILNKTTNTRYIGSSKDIAGRWKNHLYQLRIKKHHCSYLQNSYNLHGFQDFSFEVIEICKTEELPYREWVNWYCEDMIFGTFNSIPVNPLGTAVIHTEESKKKMSEARDKGKKSLVIIDGVKVNNPKYQKEYRAKNKESLGEYNKDYQKDYTQKNKEKKKDYMKEYRAKNRESVREKNKEYRAKNKEKNRQYQEKYREKKNLEKNAFEPPVD